MTTEPTERESGLELAMSLVTASMDANFRTMDTLHEGERKHRMALEVLIDVFLDHAAAAHMGTVREYEDAIDILRYKGNSRPGQGLGFNGSDWIEVLSKLHPENTERY
jgi:hypothetical protein